MTVCFLSSFFFFDWVEVLWPQLSKVLKHGFQARSKDREILEEGGGAGPSTLPRRDHE